MSSELPGERIVAFLDILGFKDLVRRMETEAGLYQLVAQVTEKLGTDIRGVFDGPLGEQPSSSAGRWLPVGGLVFSHFSDSIIISGPTIGDVQGDARTLRTICSFCSSVATRLLRHGILVRGGIARGWMRHDDSLAIGAGLTQAYLLESLVAKWPRIVMSDPLAKMMSDARHWLRQDSDLVWFLNPVGSLAGAVSLGIKLDDTYSEIPTSIERELAREQPAEVRAKYRWIARQFNEEVEWAVSIAGKEPDWLRRITLV